MTEQGKQKLLHTWELIGKLLLSIEGNPGQFLSSQTTMENFQNSVIRVGETLEHTLKMEEQEALVPLLEEYCECIYRLTLHRVEETEWEATYHQLRSLHNAIGKRFEDIKSRRLAVFLPYQFSMWDSLESIYRAAEEDSNWDAVVMPIPYADLDDNQNVKEWKYEGEAFGEFSIQSWETYLLEEQLPDVIYIHNPYDDANRVTRVAPQFYSSELKKSTGCLVYVPYFFAGEDFPDVHCRMPSYQNMDYIVVPTQRAANQMAEYVDAAKILVLGSPKLDRMLSLSGKKEIPAEYQSRIRGRKCVLLNTSVNALLQQGFTEILKMRQVFDYFKENQNLVLWWRPHPLYEATLQSMRPELLGAYQEMKKAFLLEKIGIYDAGPDSNAAVAATDAFLGDGSSLQNMYGITGKPIFILNNRAIHEPTQEDRRTLIPGMVGYGFDDPSIGDTRDTWLSWQLVTKGGETLVFDMGRNMLYATSMDMREQREIKRFPYPMRVVRVLHIDRKTAWELICYPTDFRNPVLFCALPYDVEKIAAEDLEWKELISESLRELPLSEYGGIIEFGTAETIFLPQRQSDVLVWNRKKDTVCSYQWDTEILSPYRHYPGEPLLSSACVRVGESLFLLSYRVNVLLELKLNSGGCQFYQIGEEEDRFSHLLYEADEKAFYFISWDGTHVVRWKREDGSYRRIEIVTALEDFNPRASSFESPEIPAFVSCCHCGEYVYLIPALANQIIRISKRTLQPEAWTLELPFEIGQRKSSLYTAPYHFGGVWFPDDKHMNLISNFDSSVLTIDLQTEMVVSTKLLLSCEEVQSDNPMDYAVRALGKGPYLFREDPLRFTLRDMMEFLEKKSDLEFDSAKQREASTEGIANANGNAGVEIHRHIAKQLGKG